MHETEVCLHCLLNPQSVKTGDSKKRKVSKAVLLNKDDVVMLCYVLLLPEMVCDTEKDLAISMKRLN